MEVIGETLPTIWQVSVFFRIEVKTLPHTDTSLCQVQRNPMLKTQFRQDSAYGVVHAAGQIKLSPFIIINSLFQVKVPKRAISKVW